MRNAYLRSSFAPSPAGVAGGSRELAAEQIGALRCSQARGELVHNRDDRRGRPNAGECYRSCRAAERSHRRPPIGVQEVLDQSIRLNEGESYAKKYVSLASFYGNNC